MTHDVLWIAAICGSWLAAMVALAYGLDVSDWWQRRRDAKLVERRLRALREWRRTGIYRR